MTDRLDEIKAHVASGKGAWDPRVDTADSIDWLIGEVVRLREALTAAEAENERHRNANLVRAVFGGPNGDIDLSQVVVNDIVNAEAFDRVPWVVAEKCAAESRAAREALTALTAATAELDMLMPIGRAVALVKARDEAVNLLAAVAAASDGEADK